MNKREFLAAAAALGAGGAVSPAMAESKRSSGMRKSRGPALLTVTGAIGRGNRGPLDPALDQMMAKQKIAFERAHVFDFETLAGMPHQSIRPTLEYDAKPHRLDGPLLTEVLQAAGAPQADTTRVLLRAVDGYAVQVALAEIRKYRLIVATHLDGAPMPLGGLGPLWAVLDADRYPDLASRPLNQRFALCPWALYHIGVEAA